MSAKRKILQTSKPEKGYVLFGIVSSVNDYRLAWLLNNKFNIELKKIDDFKVDIKELGSISCHSRYSTDKELTKLEILTNKDLNSLKLFKLDFDFFLRISDEFNDTKNIKGSFNEISEIILAREIVASKQINEALIKKIMLAFS